MTSTREPVFTPRSRLGLGLLASGLGLMLFCGKVLGTPLPLGIASGIAIAVAGFVVVVVDALGSAPEERTSDDGPRGGSGPGLS
jgi:hypothetical protein